MDEAKLKTGDKVYRVPGGRWSEGDTPEFVEVFQVGRIYATLSNGMRINAKTCEADYNQSRYDVGYLARNSCYYRSPEAYETKLSRDRARLCWDTIKRGITWSMPDHLDLASVEQLATILHIELPKRPDSFANPGDVASPASEQISNPRDQDK